MNKSFATNFIALLLVIIGHTLDFPYKLEVFSFGVFALSGALTNWLAIHMLFEKVPGLYGSGVIPSRFQEFKAGIKELVMGQFFNNENIDKFFQKTANKKSVASEVDFSPLLETVNYDKIFNDLLETVEQSSFGGMLSMFGGSAALVPLKEPFITKVKASIVEVTKTQEFLNALEDNILPSNLSDGVVEKVEEIVDSRLEELTPKMVKEIIQEMIHKHLGWLVVWGGIFGGIVGLLLQVFGGFYS